MIAIGKSKILYDTIKYLSLKKFKFDAIITDEVFEKYEVDSNDFRKLAISIGSEFFITKKINLPEIINLINERKTKLAITANWKFFIPESFVSLFKSGILNLHLGNLPDYKGNATVNWTILNGEKHIYANIHKVTQYLDAGDIIAREKIKIPKNMYVKEVLEKIYTVAPALFEKAIIKLKKNPSYYLIKGTRKGLRCYPRLPEDSRINWNEPAEKIHRLIRASSKPFEGAYTFLNDEKVTIWKAYVKKKSNPFLSSPGHIVETDKNSGNIVVTCRKSMLIIEEIEYKNKTIKPAELVKSIRVRFT